MFRLFRRKKEEQVETRHMLDYIKEARHKRVKDVEDANVVIDNLNQELLRRNDYDSAAYHEIQKSLQNQLDIREKSEKPAKEGFIRKHGGVMVGEFIKGLFYIGATVLIIDQEREGSIFSKAFNKPRL